MHECVLYTSVCFAIMYSSHTWTAQVQARASPGAAGPCHDGLGDAVLCRSKAVARPAPGRSKAKLLTRTEILLSARHSILLHVCDASEEPSFKITDDPWSRCVDVAHFLAPWVRSTRCNSVTTLGRNVLSTCTTVSAARNIVTKCITIWLHCLGSAISNTCCVRFLRSCTWSAPPSLHAPQQVFHVHSKYRIVRNVCKVCCISHAVFFCILCFCMRNRPVHGSATYNIRVLTRTLNCHRCPAMLLIAARLPNSSRLCWKGWPLHNCWTH